MNTDKEHKPTSPPWIEALASYLTGWIVGRHSICLSMPKESPSYREAREFFNLRDAYGIRGWANKEEAERCIKATVTASPMESS